VLTADNARWCLLVLAVLAAALGAVWHLGRDTYYDGSAR
jgi:hypothetical protein